MIKKVCHTGITVKNLEKSIDFYCNVLGLKLVNPPSEFITDEDTAKALGAPDAIHRICTLDAGGDLVELLEYQFPNSPVETPMPQYTIGAEHIGFLVDDIHAVVDKLTGMGLQFNHKPLLEDGIWWVVFQDPDGISIELIQED